MSTPSSTARSATATSPQVTASVVKFHCLYTHDLRRKSKRWQDGYLRYHKFNKRIMVYDENGNFIGDHHWRSNDEVQDGDELELDKGVLIQVTECTGTSETDITNLYEKRKASQGSPHTKDSMSQAPRSSAPIRSSASSQSFRSLNDLLNIKKTPIGHLVSPYEQRNPPQKTRNTQEIERPVKRQKTTPAVPANPERNPGAHSQVIDLTESNPTLPTRHETNTQADQEPSSSAGYPVANAYPTVRQATRTVAPKPTIPQRPNPPSNTRSAVVAAPGMTNNRSKTMAPPRVAPTNKTPQDPPRSMQSQGTDPVVTRNPVPAVPAMGSSRLKPRAPLLTAPKAVQPDTPVSNGPQDLPQPQRPNHTEFSRPSVTDLSTESRPPSPQRRTAADEPVTGVRDRSNEMSNSMQPPRPEPPTASRPPPVPKPLTTRSIPNTSAHADNKNLEPPKLTNDAASNAMPPPSRPSPALPSDKPTTSLRMAAAKPRRKLMYNALLPGDILQKSSSPPTRTPPDPKPRETTTTSQEPQFTRPVVLPTENLGTANEDFMPSASTQFIFDEMLDGSGFKPPSVIRNLMGRRSLDSPLRKSLSDPTALNSRQGHQARSSLTRSFSNAADQENKPKEEGPWTSEALDLFDFWPAGRPKPT